LPLIIFAHLMLISFMSSALAEANSRDLDSDHSWIKELATQADTLAKTHQEEAQSIVAGVLANQHKSCTAAKVLAQKGNEIARKTLEPSEDEARYPKLLVFVSFSMPPVTLKTLGSQVNAVGGNLVLRGLVNGGFKETAEKLKELQEEIIIDPTLFEAYGITLVPTFVLRSESTRKVKNGSYDRLSGNVSLEYALEQFALSGDTRQVATQLLQDLRRVP